MKDHDQDELKQKPLEPQDRLETVAFHLTQLYQRLAQDRDSWAMTGGDLAEALEAFEKQLQQLATLEERLRQQLKESIEEKTRQVTAIMSDSFKQATKVVLSENIEETADHLIKIFQNADQILSHHQQDIANTKKWWLGIAFISALLGGILGGAIFYLLL